MTSTLFHPRTDTLDLREIAPRERHALIFGSFNKLAPGQALQLVNDHDPRPLRQQFDERFGGQFEWTALEAGPTVWRVQITRVGAGQGAAPAGDSCCSGGACCG